MGKTAEYGIERLYFYPISGGAYLPGIRNEGERAFSKEETVEPTNFYAGNTIHKTIEGVKQIEGSWVTYQVEESVMTNLLGYYKEANGGLSDSGQKMRTGVAYVIKFNNADNVEQYKLRVVYDILLGALSVNDTTTEDAVELNENEVAYTGRISDIVKSGNGNNLSYFEMLFDVGVGIDEIEEFLTEIPLPTSTEIPTFESATGSIGTLTPTSADVTGTYDYAEGDEEIAQSKIEIFDAIAPLEVVDVLQPLTSGTATDFTFTGLAPDTAYIIKMSQGTNILSEQNFTTLSAARTTKNTKDSKGSK